MDKLFVILTLMGLLTSGVESFKISEKEYENIDRMMKFGVQVFLNCLDKVKEATEKLVKEDMLRTNRIAIQDNWNSFRETANRISVEERGKGEQDDLIVAARTVRRLVLQYKDDVQKIFHTVIMEQNVQLYLPVVNTFKGTIEKAKANEIWDNMVSNYLPDAPSIENEPLEFLCYLLSTSTVETYVVNVLKFGVEVISQIKKIDFDEVTERVRAVCDEVREKFYEIERTEREKEKDNFLVLVSAVSRAVVFYWDRFLNTTDTPELKEKFEVSARVVFKTAVIHADTVYEQLSERGLFSEVKRLYFRAVDVGTALAGTEEIQYFRETYYEKWKSFREELNKLVNEERSKSDLPQVRAVARMLAAKFEELVDKVNADIDDDKVQQMITKWSGIKDKCIKKLLTSGALTQDQLDEAQSVFLTDMVQLYEKYLQSTETMDPQRVKDTFKALVKVVDVGLNFIYAPLEQARDFLLA
ncbi:hypothetical protein AOLI_G00315290 [Acnodon oligacanthus]